MRNINVSELEGAALDWAVAVAAYPKSYQSGDRLRVRAIIDGEECTIGSVFFGRPGTFTPQFSPSTDWSQGGPLIEQYGIGLQKLSNGWMAATDEMDFATYEAIYGPTPLIAAMRAIVAAEIGDTVDVPEELMK